MEHKGGPKEGVAGAKQEDLPKMDGLCDVCEPDEAHPATHVCHACSFAFCPVHAEKHADRTHHSLMPYNHEGTQNDMLRIERNARLGGEAKEEGGAERAAGANQEMEPLGVAVANVDECSDAVEKGAGQNNLPSEARVGDGAGGAEAGPEAVAAVDAWKRDTVTVERLRCPEHGQEGSLYCKPHEKIICVVCAVQGDHKDHEIITLYEAYSLQKSRHCHDLLGFTRQMGEKIKAKWTDPEMSPEELEAYVNIQFDELRKMVHQEEKRTLHLVDLKEAFLTASAAEKIAEISVETERLQEEMANITRQLCVLERAEENGPAGVAQALAAAPGPNRRLMNDIEARPRLPIDAQDFKDDDSGPSKDHAP